MSKVCLCRGITEEQIVEAIKNGASSFEEVKEENKKVATDNNRVYPASNRDSTVIKSVTTGARKSPNLPNYYNNGEHMISRLTLIISIIALILSVYNLLVILGVLK